MKHGGSLTGERAPETDVPSSRTARVGDPSELRAPAQRETGHGRRRAAPGGLARCGQQLCGL